MRWRRRWWLRQWRRRKKKSRQHTWSPGKCRIKCRLNFFGVEESRSRKLTPPTVMPKSWWSFPVVRGDARLSVTISEDSFDVPRGGDGGDRRREINRSDRPCSTIVAQSVAFACAFTISTTKIHDTAYICRGDQTVTTLTRHDVDPCADKLFPVQAGVVAARELQVEIHAARAALANDLVDVPQGGLRGSRGRTRRRARFRFRLPLQ